MDYLLTSVKNLLDFQVISYYRSDTMPFLLLCVTVVLVIVVGVPPLSPISLGQITASFIPDLPLVHDKVKHLPL